MISSQACLSALPPLTHTTTCAERASESTDSPTEPTPTGAARHRLLSSYFQFRINMRQPVWMHVSLQECELINVIWMRVNVWYDIYIYIKKKTQWPPFSFLHFWSAGFYFLVVGMSALQGETRCETLEIIANVFWSASYLNVSVSDQRRREEAALPRHTTTPKGPRELRGQLVTAQISDRWP